MKRNEFNSYFSFRSNRLIFTKIQGMKRTNRQTKRTNSMSLDQAVAVDEVAEATDVHTSHGCKKLIC